MFIYRSVFALPIALFLMQSSFAAQEIETPLHASPPNDPAWLTQSAAVARALAENQSLAELRLTAEALGAVPPQAGALPDPMLGLNALNFPTDTYNFDQEPMTQMQVSLTQALPFPGKRGLRRDAAESDAAAAIDRLEDRRLVIAAEVRGAWWQLFYLDRAIEIVQQNQALMREFIEIAITKYKVGDGLQQDVLLAQLELSRLLNRELPLRSLRSATQAALNALMNAPSENKLRLPGALESVVLRELPAEADLLQRAVDERPMLEAERKRMEAARLRVDLARKDYLPDFVLGAAYGFRDGADATGRERPNLATLRLGVSLPIYSGSKQSKAAQQRKSEYFRQKATFNEQLRNVQSMIAMNYAGYLAARDQVALYDGAIIPQAQQTVAAMLAGYQVNEVDFLNVVNAEIMLYNAQISYWESFSNAKKALASLAAAVGSESIYE